MVFNLNRYSIHVNKMSLIKLGIAYLVNAWLIKAKGLEDPWILCGFVFFATSSKH